MHDNADMKLSLHHANSRQTKHELWTLKASIIRRETIGD